MSDNHEDLLLLIAAIKSFDAIVKWDSIVPELGISGTSSVPARHLA